MFSPDSPACSTSRCVCRKRSPHCSSPSTWIRRFQLSSTTPKTSFQLRFEFSKTHVKIQHGIIKHLRICCTFCSRFKMFPRCYLPRTSPPRWSSWMTCSAPPPWSYIHIHRSRLTCSEKNIQEFFNSHLELQKNTFVKIQKGMQQSAAGQSWVLGLCNTFLNTLIPEKQKITSGLCSLFVQLLSEDSEATVVPGTNPNLLTMETHKKWSRAVEPTCLCAPSRSVCFAATASSRWCRSLSSRSSAALWGQRWTSADRKTNRSTFNL